MTTYPYTPEPEPHVNPWWIRLPVLFITGTILVVASLIGLTALYQVQYQNKIIPGVSAYGLELGGMSREEAIAALDARFTYDQEAVFTFRDGERFWQLNAGDLGVSIDTQAAVEQAVRVGHSGNPLVDVVDQLLVWLNGQPVSPVVRYDQAVAVSKLTSIANEINRPARDATLAIEGTEIRTTPGQVGLTVDVLETLNRLNDTIASLNSGMEVSLVLKETPPRIWDAEVAANKARVALSSPIQLVAQSADGQPLGPWTANVDQIAHLLRIDLIGNESGAYIYDVSIDMGVFTTYLETLAPGLIATPKDARFIFNDDTQQLEVLVPAVYGRTLNIPNTLEQMKRAVFEEGGSRSVAMEFDFTSPRYHDEITGQELGITEMVSSATTFYTGSTAPRRENIAQAASRFNGIIIAPGEEFSFNYWVGDISPEEGFVEGKVIVGGRTINGVGGGVCQVSTTAFQAAFYAGYPILERYAHGYQVGYYRLGEGVGMDAAIYVPDLDFRFLNDTPHHLLIETSLYPQDNTIEFRFYSTDVGREVIKEGPIVENVQSPAATTYEANPELQPGQQLQVDWAAEGADVTVRRLVLDAAGNEIRRDEFVSRYQPWGAIIQVAPGEVPST